LRSKRSFCSANVGRVKNLYICFDPVLSSEAGGKENEDTVICYSLLEGENDLKKQEKFQHIINILEKAPRVAAPDDFTDLVMARMGTCPSRYGALKRLRDFLIQPRAIKGLSLFPEGITGRQCGFFFMLVSLFYLVVGLMFLLSMETITSAGYNAVWLLYQPEVAFGVAVGFALLGISFISGRPVSVRSARLGILIYVGAIIMNNIFLQMDLKIPIVALALLPLTIGSIIIGGLLTYVMDRYSSNISFQS